MYRREDQYRSIDQQMASSRRARRRSVYRRRRLFALLTVMVGVAVAVFFQAGAGLPSILPTNTDLASGGSPNESRPSGLTDDSPSGDGTVLSVDRSASEPSSQGIANEETTNEARDREQARPEGGEGDEKPEAPPPASGEPLNVLILGVDRRPSEGETAGRSDTMMLAQVSPGSGQVELLSVPRDLFVEIEPGVEDRINMAYSYGGVEQAKAVMEGVTGVPIDAHAIIDFQGFEEVIETMGGVTVDVKPDEFPDKWHMGEGDQRLGGRKALFYARYRGTAGGDLDRIERQQRLLAGLRAKMLRWNTVTKLPSMLKIANDNVDTDMGIMQAISLGRALALRGGKDDLHAVQLKGYPETLPSGAQVLVPDWEANEQILQEFRQ